MLCVPPDAAKDAEGESMINMPRSNSRNDSVVRLGVHGGGAAAWPACGVKSLQPRSVLGREAE